MLWVLDGKISYLQYKFTVHLIFWLLQDLPICQLKSEPNKPHTPQYCGTNHIFILDHYTKEKKRFLLELSILLNSPLWVHPLTVITEVLYIASLFLKTQ